MTDNERELRKLEDQMADIFERKSGKSVAKLHRRIQQLKRMIKEEKKEC